MHPGQTQRCRKQTGRLWHQGEEITHAGLRTAILRWLDVLDDGRAIVRLDATRYAYIDVDDAHLRATSLRWDGETPIVHLDDGSDEPLELSTLRLGADHALLARVRGGRLTCRLTTAAQQQLEDRMLERDGHPVLRVDGRDWPLERA